MSEFKAMVVPALLGALAFVSTAASAEESFVYRKPAPQAVCAEAHCALSAKVGLPHKGSDTSSPGPGTEQPSPPSWHWGAQTVQGWELELGKGSRVIDAVVTDGMGTDWPVTPASTSSKATFDWNVLGDGAGTSIYYYISTGSQYLLVVTVQGSDGTSQSFTTTLQK